MSEVIGTKENNPDDELCSLMIGGGEGVTYLIPPPPTTTKQDAANAENFRMVEWEGIGNVVFAVNESVLFYDDLLDLLQDSSRIGVRGYQFDEEDLENDGPLPSLLKVLCRLIIIRDLYHCDALDVFSSGSYSDLLPPLMGQIGIRLVEVDTQESGLHSLFVGKPYSA